MFWRKKVPDTINDNLSPFEFYLIKELANSLKDDYGKKLIEQLSYLKKIRSITYKSDCAIELYPEKLDSIPENIRFNKRDDFKLATMKIEFGVKQYTIKFYMVLGEFFEMRISPIFNTKKVTLNEERLKIIQIKLDESYY